MKWQQRFNRKAQMEEKQVPVTPSRSEVIKKEYVQECAWLGEARYRFLCIEQGHLVKISALTQEAAAIDKAAAQADSVVPVEAKEEVKPDARAV